MIYNGPSGLTLDLTLLIGVGKKKEFEGSPFGVREYRRTLILWFQGNTINLPVESREEREQITNEILNIRFGNKP